jgi:hypothetical protein
VSTERAGAATGNARRVWARSSLAGLVIAVATCTGNRPEPVVIERLAAAATTSACTFTLTDNRYDASEWWGTISFSNNGPSSASNYVVEFDVPSGKHCTADAGAIPTGATLSPLVGTGSSAHTISNHCIFTWTNTTPLPAAASKTFHYSTDSNASNFVAATGVIIGDTMCGAGTSACNTYALTYNNYDGPEWWGTVTFKNTGPFTAWSYSVAFDVPGGAHCTAEADAIPTGATLSPLAGTGSSAHTSSNHCIFTWVNGPALAPGASKTFNYSADTQSSTDATHLVIGDTACLGPVSSPADFTISLKTPLSVPVTAVALAAESSMVIGSSSVIGRAGSARTVVSNLGAGRIEVGAQSSLGDIWSASTVTLGSNATVAGKVRAPAVVVGSGATIGDGTDLTASLTPPTVSSWTVHFEGPTNDVAVASGQSAAPPGNYRNLRVAGAGTLTLSAGAYFADSLQLDVGSRLVINQDAGPVLLYVRNVLQAHGRIESSRGAAPEFFVAYLGTAPLVLDAAWNGLLAAPNAALKLLATPGAHVGAFFARNLELGSGTRVTFRPAQSMLAPAAAAPDLPPPAAGRWRCSLTDASLLRITPTSSATPPSAVALTGAMSFEVENGVLRVPSWQGATGSAAMGSGLTTLSLANNPATLNGSIAADGTVSFTTAVTFIAVDQTLSPFTVPLGFLGTLRSGLLKGSAVGQVPSTSAVLPGATVSADLACDQRIDEASVALQLTVGTTGATTVRQIDVLTSIASNIRSLGSDILVRTFNDRGERLEEFSIRDPRVVSDGTALSTTDFTLSLPLTGGLRRVELVRAATVVPIDLTSPLQTFCASHVGLADCQRLAGAVSFPATVFEAPAAATTVSRQLGGEILVDEGSASPPALTAAADQTGNAVIAWTDAAPSGGFGVFATGLAADGSTAFAKARLDVSPGGPGALVSSPGVARAPDGRFGAAWLVKESSGLGHLRARLFAADGTPATGEILVQEQPSGLDQMPSVGMDSQGKLLVVWTDRSLSIRQSHVFARRLAADGSFDGGRFEVRGGMDLGPFQAAVAVVPAGAFIVTWQEQLSAGDVVLNGRRYDASRNAQDGSPVRIADSSFGDHTVQASGGATNPFIVAYRDTETTLKLRRIPLLASPAEAAFAANGKDTAPIVTTVENVAVAQSAAGRFFAAWRESAGRIDASHPARNAVTAEIFDADSGPLDVDFPVVDLPSDSVLVGGSPVVVPVGDRFLVAWSQQRGTRPSQILARLYDGLPYPCQSCGDAKALMSTGGLRESANLVAFRRGDLSFAGVTNGPTFARFVVTRILNGWFNYEALAPFRNRFNLFIVPDPVASGNPRVPMSLPVLFLNSTGSGVCSSGLAQVNSGLSDARNFGHEVGHCLFDLVDERPCNEPTSSPRDSERGEAPRHPNLFKTQARCQALSQTPGACREIPNTRLPRCSVDAENDGWWVADPSDIMDGGLDFGPDCARNISLFFQGLR